MKTNKQYYFDPVTRTGGYVVRVHDGYTWVAVNPLRLVTEAQAACMRKELRKHNYPEVNANITLHAMCERCLKNE